MAQKVAVPKKELQKARKKLKQDQELTIKDISDEIGAEFKNYLYKEFNMPKEAFEKLQEASGLDLDHQIVDHRNGVSYSKRILSLQKDGDLAEFFGMMLGDGHIQNYSLNRGEKYVTNYRVELCFNEDETKIIDRARKLFLSTSGREPRFHANPNNKGAKLMVYSKDLVEKLIELGLKPGNKTENQVDVPGWIKEKTEFQVRCLRGLTDTDGTVYERAPGDKVIQFKNASHPLLNDFREMCKNQSISTSKGGYRTVQVAANDDVRRFIRLIQPVKCKTA